MTLTLSSMYRDGAPSLDIRPSGCDLYEALWLHSAPRRTVTDAVSVCGSLILPENLVLTDSRFRRRAGGASQY